MKRIRTVKSNRLMTPKQRLRGKQALTVQINQRGRIQLPPMSKDWRIGRTVYWKVRVNREVIGRLTPKGMLNRGRYTTSRIRR